MDRILLSIKNLEERFFYIILLCAVPYFILHISVGFIARNDPLLNWVFLTFLVSCLVTLILIRRRYFNHKLITAFTLFFIIGYSFYLPYSGGPNSGAAYSLQVLVITSVMMSNNKIRPITSVLLIAVLFVFISEYFTYDENVNYLRLLLDYILNLSFMALFMILFKRSYDLESGMTIQENIKVEQANKDLIKQTEKLDQTNDEINNLMSNLEATAEERAQLIEEKNQKMLEYSFINAHLLRAPISNILGLCQMKPNDPDYRTLEEKAKELDNVVRKIGSVLSKD